MEYLTLFKNSNYKYNFTFEIIKKYNEKFSRKVDFLIVANGIEDSVEKIISQNKEITDFQFWEMIDISILESYNRKIKKDFENKESCPLNNERTLMDFLEIMAELKDELFP